MGCRQSRTQGPTEPADRRSDKRTAGRTGHPVPTLSRWRPTAIKSRHRPHVAIVGLLTPLSLDHCQRAQGIGARPSHFGGRTRQAVILILGENMGLKMALFIKREFTWAEGARKSSIRFSIKIAPVPRESAAATTRRFKQEAARIARAFVKTQNRRSPNMASHRGADLAGGSHGFSRSFRSRITNAVEKCCRSGRDDNRDHVW
jgi:hypothetical protein